MKYYILDDAETNTIRAGEIKKTDGQKDTYEWVDSEDCTSSFFNTIISILSRNNREFIISANNEPKYKLALQELNEKEIEEIKQKLSKEIAQNSEETETETETE